MEKDNIKNNIKKKDTKSTNKKFVFIVILVIILCALLTLFAIKSKNDKANIYSYDDYMDILGFTKYFTDDSEYVKKIEAIKIILCVASNTNDLQKYQYSTKENEDDRWIDIAYDFNAAPNYYFDNNKDANISLVDTIELLGMTKENVLKKEISDTEDIKLTDYNEYYDYYQKYIKDMIATGVIDNKEENLNGYEDITKSKFNEILVRYMFKNNILVREEEKIDYDKTMKLDKTKGYPFVLEGIDDSSYNKKYEVVNQDNFLTPNEVYKKFGRVSYNTLDFYLEKILNIDYETIDENIFYNNIGFLSKYTKDEITEYVKYVKDNKIKVSSEAKIVKPIVYFDGENYRLRVQINYEILNSDTDKNIFLFDKGLNKKYSKKDTICLDLKIDVNDTGFISKFI